VTTGAPTGESAGANDVAVQQKRLITSLAINGVCVLVALAGIVGGMALHIEWMNLLFLAALLVGFGAQIWLIIGFLRGRSKP
jgi:hypothetical protein